MPHFIDRVHVNRTGGRRGAAAAAVFAAIDKDVFVSDALLADGAAIGAVRSVLFREIVFVAKGDAVTARGAAVVDALHAGAVEGVLGHIGRAALAAEKELQFARVEEDAMAAGADIEVDALKVADGERHVAAARAFGDSLATLETFGDVWAVVQLVVALLAVAAVARMAWPTTLSTMSRSARATSSSVSNQKPLQLVQPSIVTPRTCRGSISLWQAGQRR